MKKFFINIVSLSACCLFALFLCELFLLTVPNRYSYKRGYIEKHLNDIQILLLGNCHIEDALIPNILGAHTFNTAISGREPVYDFEIAKRYIPQMNQLKVVLMQFDYRSFAFGRERNNPRDYKIHGGHEATFKCMYYKYMGMRVDPFWYWSEILNSELDYKKRIWVSFAHQIESDTLGFVKLLDVNKIDNWEYWDLPRIYDLSKPIDQSEYDNLYNGYRTLAQISHKCGVRLILVSTPMYKTYQEDMIPEVEEEMCNFINKIKKEYPDVEYYDFQHDGRFLPEDFHDASHLSESGSRKFSEIIHEIIINQPTEINEKGNL